MIICNLEEGTVSRPIFDREHFHRTLISLGHATRHMPCLKYMNYSLGHTPNFRFEFQPHGSSGKAEWLLYSLYRPDQRVADAWKFPLVELDAKLPRRLTETTIANWVQI